MAAKLSALVDTERPIHTKTFNLSGQITYLQGTITNQDDLSSEFLLVSDRYQNYV